jgi:hypothetical protein
MLSRHSRAELEDSRDGLRRRCFITKPFDIHEFALIAQSYVAKAVPQV